MLPMNCVYFSQFSLILSIIYSVSYSHNLYPVNPNPNHRQPVYHQTNGHFSGVKPNPPNPPSVKQWETRTWISTIPLSKAQDVNREPHSLSQSPPPPPPSLSSLPVASSDHRHEDYNYARYTPKVTEYVHRTHGSHPYRPVLNATQYSTVRSPEPMKPCRIGSNSEKCRKSPFQGTYDTINYQKKFIYPEKSASRQVDESYGTRYRQSGSEEEDYDNRGGNVHWTPHNHHGRWEDSHPRPHQSSGSYGGGSSSGKRDRHPEKTSYHHSSSYSSDHEPWQENSKYKDHPKNGYEYDDNDYDKEREWRTGSSYTSQENYPNEKEERPTPQPAPAKKNKPKVREFHHDDDNPDGFSHAHGYEKVEEEGTRFFEPSELQSYDESLPLDPRNRDNLASIPKSKTGMKHCDCSHANMPRYQSHLVDRMSRPLPKKYESGAELDQSSAPEYRADSGEYSSQETKSIPGVVLGVKGYSNTTGF